VWQFERQGRAMANAAAVAIKFLRLSTATALSDENFAESRIVRATFDMSVRE
jgi:hypothetical protein